MYKNESDLLSKIEKKKKQLKSLKSDVREMKKDYRNQKKLRIDLNDKFDDLQNSGASKWEDFKKEYEMVLDFAEGDKNSFIQAAEGFLEELNERISGLEESMKESSAQAKDKSKELLDLLNERKDALTGRLEEARSDTGELWKEVKQWFIERANSIRAIF
jgi:DNA repair exonuclease SbcCD ATPase subunit